MKAFRGVMYTLAAEAICGAFGGFFGAVVFFDWRPF